MKTKMTWFPTSQYLKNKYRVKFQNSLLMKLKHIAASYKLNKTKLPLHFRSGNLKIVNKQVL